MIVILQDCFWRLFWLTLYALIWLTYSYVAISFLTLLSKDYELHAIGSALTSLGQNKGRSLATYISVCALMLSISLLRLEDEAFKWGFEDAFVSWSDFKGRL